MTRSILLVRHARTDWTGLRWCGRTDLPLNEAGRAEARELAAALATQLRRPDFVTSPALRAHATAEILAEPFAAEVTTDPDLRETDFGAADGLAWDELCLAYPGVAAAILAGGTDVEWPGGEKAASLADRVERAWRRLTAASRGGEVVAVTHGAVMAVLLRRLSTGGGDRPSFMGPASVVRIEATGGTWRVAT